ncbi:hypothetical protein MXB_1625, partial [Myxobolus squamalis]
MLIESLPKSHPENTKINEINIDTMDYHNLETLSQFILPILMDISRIVSEYSNGCLLKDEAFGQFYNHFTKMHTIFKKIVTIIDAIDLMESKTFIYSSPDEDYFINSENDDSFNFTLAGNKEMIIEFLKKILTKYIEKPFDNIVLLFNEFCSKQPVGLYSHTFKMFRNIVDLLETKYQSNLNIPTLKTVLQYFCQFEATIRTFCQKNTDKIRKELSDYTTIVKWRDFNYWSIKESSDVAHRVLHKYINNYRVLLNEIGLSERKRNLNDCDDILSSTEIFSSPHIVDFDECTIDIFESANSAFLRGLNSYSLIVELFNTSNSSRILQIIHGKIRGYLSHLINVLLNERINLARAVGAFNCFSKLIRQLEHLLPVPMNIVYHIPHNLMSDTCLTLRKISGDINRILLIVKARPHIPDKQDDSSVADNNKTSSLDDNPIETGGLADGKGHKDVTDQLEIGENADSISGQQDPEDEQEIEEDQMSAVHDSLDNQLDPDLWNDDKIDESIQQNQDLNSHEELSNDQKLDKLQEKTIEDDQMSCESTLSQNLDNVQQANDFTCSQSDHSS